jgi:glycosyltransferase involved in cell wall biosynthesis
MKIAQIAPIWFSVPPQSPGGAETLIRYLVDTLTDRHNEVTLFATKNSKVKGEVISLIPEGIGEKNFPIGREFFLRPLEHMVFSLDYIKKHQFDIIHCHITSLADYILLALTRDLKNCVYTFHQTFPTPQTNSDRYNLLKYMDHIKWVTISQSQRIIDIPFFANIYNGIPINDYKYSENEKDPNESYIIWMSRFNRTKGLKEALQTVSNTKRKFLFFGFANNDEDKMYYENEISPLLSSYTLDKGMAVLKDKNEYIPGAKLFLFPIQWDEPFGLVITEALACGTPVVAFARGAVAEIVKDGQTGFIVNPSADDIRGDFIIKKTGIEGLREAVERIYAMPEEEYKQMRKKCRAHVEENFTVEKMVDQYEKVYKRVIAESK